MSLTNEEMLNFLEEDTENTESLSSTSSDDLDAQTTDLSTGVGQSQRERDLAFLEGTETPLSYPGSEDLVTVQDNQGDPVQINRNVMVENDPDLGLAHKSRIVAGSLLESAAESVEFPFKVVAGAVDELTALLGRDTSKSGAYPLQDIVDSIIRFDETAKQILPKKDRVPITAADFGIQAVATGVGSAIPITGGILAQGGRTVVRGGNLAGSGVSALPLTTGQQASIASGKTLRTPTDVLATAQGVNKAGGVTTTATFAEKQAAATGAAIQTDLALSGAAGVGSATGASLASDQSAEGRAQGAAIGELAGIGTGIAAPGVVAVLKSISPVNWAVKTTWKKSEPVRELMTELFDRESYRALGFKEKMKPSNWKNFINERALERYGRKDVLEHLDGFLRTDDVKQKVTRRLQMIEEVNSRLKAIDPNTNLEFQPGLGVIIGTEESLAFQQITDFHNYEQALLIQDKNQKALKQVQKMIEKDPSFKYSDNLADMFELMSKDTEVMLTTLSNKMDDVAKTIFRNTFEEATNPTQEAEVLRRHFGNMQDVYTKMSTDLHEMVQVPKNIRFKTDALLTRLGELTDPTNADNILDQGLTTLEKSLPRAIRASAEKGKATGLDYEALTSYYRRLGADIQSVRSINPKSAHISTLSEIRSSIETIIDKGIETLPEEFDHVRQARKTARAFFRDELVPRFREGVTGQLDNINPDGTLRITDDAVMSKFWQQGAKTEGARDFKSVFEDFADRSKKTFELDDLSTLASNAADARSSLLNHALSTLQDDLRRAGQRGLDNPEKILESWKFKYRGALEEFPNIARRTETIEDVFKAIGEATNQFQKQKAHLNHSVISKYLDTEPTKVIKTFLSSRRNAQNVFDQIDSVYGHQPEKVQAIKTAIADATVNHIIQSSVDKVSGNFNYTRIARMMDEAGDSLPLIINRDDLDNLVVFNTGLGILNKQPAILQKAELNDFKKALESAGISPASILSRYYSASLGKVGPVYLGTDAATRYLTKKAEVYFKDLYRELMYNPQTLRDLNKLLLEVSSEAAQKSGNVSKTTTRKLASILSTAGVRVYNNDIFDDEEDRDAFIGTDEDVMEYNPTTGELTPYERSTN